MFRIFIGVLISMSLSFSSMAFELEDYAGDQPVLVVHGSNTLGAKLVPKLIQAFFQQSGATAVKVSYDTKENRSVIVGQLESGQSVQAEVIAKGSSTGFIGLGNGAADIAASSRPINRNEALHLSKLGDMRSPENEHIVAIDGLAVIVHPSNSIKKLTIPQVSQIFQGKITNWKAVGGANAPIHVLARDNKSGTYDTFKHLVLDKHTLSNNAKRFDSNDKLSTSVTLDVNSIGFVALASVGGAKAISISYSETLPLKPSELTVATEDYPLSRRLYLYAPEKNKLSELAQRFLEFSTSNSGQHIVREVGFVSQALYSLEPLPENLTDSQRELFDLGWQRINLNIRFVNGASTLDNKASRDVHRLAKFLDTEKLNIQEVRLVGYSNIVPKNASPKVISQLRAQNVRWQLRDIGVKNKIKTSAGKATLVANASSNYGDKNRRVEIWVK